ncbi:ThiF family adenylyltransferase [Geodermatophilus sp. DSM 44513]|uniref:ThiF family adenylyltransferase n=1 Tax=Geodermatophilus sp. DSM 44513 TaxID=1528104 RepID=UPI001283AE46|nr:ThiF family adenylyltransferase [Geodermatophilus sp. DSM 44513]WNV74685.1 ThiF family adenylyltransferase [Geodermatophilus sp. DSM 44513]
MADTAHPLLPPGVPLLRVPRAGGAEDVQVGGTDSRDGLVVSPGAAGLTGLLRGLDGRRTQRAVLAEAAGAGHDPAAVSDLLDGLRGTGLLVDLDPADLLAADTGPAAEARTRTELPTATDPAAGARWRARRTATVVVDGATRVGVPLAAVLAASGVGRVSVRDDGVTAAGDAVVGGLGAGDEGRPRSLAAADAVRRASPLTDLRPLAAGRPADLVVLTRPWAACDPLAADLQRRGVRHLVATVRGETGVVGPLVVPGATGCLRCADLHRRDADPRWPALAAQLGTGDLSPGGATVTCLATAVTAAVQVLALVDGRGAPVTVGTTVELRPPDLLPRTRRWPAHPDCGCVAGVEDAGPPPASGRPADQGTMGA